jgi:hypothetical protein
MWRLTLSLPLNGMFSALSPKFLSHVMWRIPFELQEDLLLCMFTVSFVFSHTFSFCRYRLKFYFRHEFAASHATGQVSMCDFWHWDRSFPNILVILCQSSLTCASPVVCNRQSSAGAGSLSWHLASSVLQKKHYSIWRLWIFNRKKGINDMFTADNCMQISAINSNKPWWRNSMFFVESGSWSSWSQVSTIGPYAGLHQIGFNLHNLFLWDSF